MNGQLSMEFIIILAVYLAFVSLLVHMQLGYIDQATSNFAGISMDAKTLAIMESERRVNNPFISMQMPSGCVTTKETAICETNGSRAEVPLSYVGDVYDDPLS